LFKDFTFFHFHGCRDFEGLRLWGFTFLLFFFSGVDFFMCVC
jgi:hypothetical protein